MEVFVDFGLFELMTAVGASIVARKIYAHWLSGGLFIAVSLALPAAVIVVAGNEPVRWLGAACFVTAIVNISVVIAVRLQGEVPALSVPRNRAAKQTSRSGS